MEIVGSPRWSGTTEILVDKQNSPNLIISIDFAFSNWIETKKLHPNYSHLKNTYTEFFHEPLWCDIAKEFPLFFYAVLVTTMLVSLGNKEPETGVIQINNLFPVPSQLSYFFCVLWIHPGLQTVPYLLTRFLNRGILKTHMGLRRYRPERYKILKILTDSCLEDQGYLSNIFFIPHSTYFVNNLTKNGITSIKKKEILPWFE